MNPETGAYVIFRRMPRPSVDLDSLSSAIEKIANQIADWKNILNGMHMAEGKAKDNDVSLSDVSLFPSSGFMQV